VVHGAGKEKKLACLETEAGGRENGDGEKGRRSQNAKCKLQIAK
jgi:hypothetical protein